MKENRRFAKDTEVELLVWAFRHKTLPGKFWTHEAHLAVGLWHNLYHTNEEALRTLRVAIREYNEACGLANTSHSGYHETLTQFYLLKIRQAMNDETQPEPLWKLANRIIERLGDRELPYRFYSKERLMSEQARKEWVEPDLVAFGDTCESAH